jgi:hypothetical protein
MASSQTGKVLNYAYVQADYECLNSLDRKYIKGYLDRLDFIEQCRINDHMTRMPLINLTQHDLLEAVFEYNNDAWKAEIELYEKFRKSSTSTLSEDDTKKYLEVQSTLSLWLSFSHLQGHQTRQKRHLIELFDRYLLSM